MKALALLVALASSALADGPVRPTPVAGKCQGGLWPSVKCTNCLHCAYCGQDKGRKGNTGTCVRCAERRAKVAAGGK